MSKHPLITIGITCFNAQASIARAITSALNQDWPNFEIIVVDDVSSDDSVKQIEKVISGVQNCQLIEHQQNLGPAGARNSILNAANGEYVVFFDDDDVGLPNRLTVQLHKMQDYQEKVNPELVVCYASGNRYYPSGHRMKLEAIGSRASGVPYGPAVADYLLYFRRKDGFFYGTGTPSCSLMASRQTLLDAGGFDPDLRRVEDVDLAIRLALKGAHFVGTSQPVFEQYSTQASDKSAEKNCEAEQSLALKHKEHLQKIGRFYYAFHWPKLRYWHFKRRYWMFLLEFLGLFLRYPVSAVRHLLSTGPTRIRHERQIETS